MQRLPNGCPEGFSVQLRCTQLTAGRAAAGTAPGAGRSTVPWKMRYHVTVWPRDSRHQPCRNHSRGSFAAGRAGPAACPGLCCRTRRWVAGSWLESSGIWGNSIPILGPLLHDGKDSPLSLLGASFQSLAPSVVTAAAAAESLSGSVPSDHRIVNATRLPQPQC